MTAYGALPEIIGRHTYRRVLKLPGEQSDSIAASGAARYRIALLTPYTGNNFGDAAILDALISHLRARIPDIRFSGISLNCENFIDRHGEMAFPLCGNSRPFHGMVGRNANEGFAPAGSFGQKEGSTRRLARKIVHRIPGLAGALKAIRRPTGSIWSEIWHCVGGFRFLRQHDLLIVAGGGQLDEEWGGPWGHPFALFKWTSLARMAHVPCDFVSVGACKVHSRTSRIFLSMALRTSQSRSFRDRQTKEIATALLARAAEDPVVPDIAFSAPTADLPPSAVIRSAAKGRRIIAISPICFCRPGSWPQEDPILYRRYLDQMSQLISQLLEKSYFVVMICSALSDVTVIKEIVGCLDERLQTTFHDQLNIPPISNWRDLLRVLCEVDLVIVSRLHSAVLSFVANRPTIAISFDKKVDRVMEDVGQSDFLLQIQDFSTDDVITTLSRIENNRIAVAEEIASYTRRARCVLDSQFDLLAQTAQ